MNQSVDWFVFLKWTIDHRHSVILGVIGCEMAKKLKHDLSGWLDSVLPLHNALTKTVVSILAGLAANNSIDVLSITGRTKSREGVLEKVKRKAYRNPMKELTDLSGIRVITFFESQVDEIAKIVESTFSIDGKNSLNKSDLLGIDRLGYRSVHFVCDLGKSRTKLSEYASFKGLRFEIQIRTVLQHAWAELAHDRNYKFSGVLPAEIQRELNLYAGMIEIADKGFDELSTKIDDYIRELKTRAESGEPDIELNSLSLAEFIQEKSDRFSFDIRPNKDDSLSKRIVKELRAFGISTISDLNNLITDQFVQAINDHETGTTVAGFVRDVMMFADLEKYFESAWNDGWGGTNPGTIDFLKCKYDATVVNSIFTKYEIIVGNESDDFLMDDVIS